MIQSSIPHGQLPFPQAKLRPSDPCRDIENFQHEMEPHWKTTFRKLDDPELLRDLRLEILPLLSTGPDSH